MLHLHIALCHVYVDGLLHKIHLLLQRILENVQKRSKTLGISNISNVPLTESKQTKTTPTKSKAATKNAQSLSSLRRRSTENKQLQPIASSNQVAACSTERSVTFETKENVDLALEINITTGPNVQVVTDFFFTCMNILKN